MAKVANGSYMKHKKLKNKLDKKSSRIYVKNQTLLGIKIHTVLNSTDDEVIQMRSILSEKLIDKKKNLDKAYDNILDNFLIIDANIGTIIIYIIKLFHDRSLKNSIIKKEKSDLMHGKLLKEFNHSLFYFRAHHATQQLVITFNAHDFMESLIPLQSLIKTSKANANHNVMMASNKLVFCVKANTKGLECDGDCGYLHGCPWCWSAKHSRMDCELANPYFKDLSRSFNNKKRGRGRGRYRGRGRHTNNYYPRGQYHNYNNYYQNRYDNNNPTQPMHQNQNNNNNSNNNNARR